MGSPPLNHARLGAHFGSLRFDKPGRRSMPRQASGLRSGNVNEEVLFCPNSHSTLIHPPCCYTSPSEMGKPGPLPLKLGKPAPLVGRNAAPMKANEHEANSRDQPTPVVQWGNCDSGERG
jgi:hypothetical protein